MIRVYIVVLNWNGCKDTIECLESLLKLKYPDGYDIVVCDNNSQDDSIVKIQAWAKDRNISVRCVDCHSGEIADHNKKIVATTVEEITVIQTGSNLGFAGGNNIGIKYALSDNRCKYVWVLNNDTVVDKNALSALVERCEQNKKIGMCGSKLVYFHQPSTIQAFGGATYNKWTGGASCIGVGESIDTIKSTELIERAMDFVAGASMLVPRTFIEEIGLMNEEYFLYFEEIDWITRANNKYTLGYASGSIVYHKEGASTKANSRSKVYSYVGDIYSTRAKLLYTRKYYPLALPFIYLTIVVMAIKRLLSKQSDISVELLMLIQNPAKKRV
jgi:GT2 family glycosyltransferase